MESASQRCYRCHWGAQLCRVLDAAMEQAWIFSELQARAHSTGAYSKSKWKKWKTIGGWLWLDKAACILGEPCWFLLPQGLAPARLGFQHLPFSVFQQHLWKVCSYLYFFFRMVTQLKLSLQWWFSSCTLLCAALFYCWRFWYEKSIPPVILLGELSIPLQLSVLQAARELKILSFLDSNKSSTHQIISSFITVPPHQKATAGKLVRYDISCRYNWAKT